MTNLELIEEFKILFEDLATNGSKGLDEYETSVCYTYAQEMLAKLLAEQGNLDDISSLVFFDTQTASVAGNYPSSVTYPEVTDSLLILNRYLSKGTINEELPVLVASTDVITSMLRSPYKYPRKGLAYVEVGEASEEVFAPYNYGATSYVRKYVKFPTPVVLVDLTTIGTGNDTIRGVSAETAPIVKPEIHPKLVELAVNYAIERYDGRPEQSLDQ